MVIISNSKSEILSVISLMATSAPPISGKYDRENIRIFLGDIENFFEFFRARTLFGFQFRIWDLSIVCNLWLVICYFSFIHPRLKRVSQSGDALNFRLALIIFFFADFFKRDRLRWFKFCFRFVLSSKRFLRNGFRRRGLRRNWFG